MFSEVGSTDRVEM